MHTQMIIETVQDIFIGADERDWQRCLDAMDETVLLDYTSLAGGMPEQLPATTIISNWKAFMPKFKATHHQLGNFVVRESEGKAAVFCYGTATHYFPNENGRNVWTVVGTYNVELVRKGKKWKVNALKLNLKYTDGNNDLPQLVQQQ